MKINCKAFLFAICQFISVVAFSLIIGTGIGFLQGLAAFSGVKSEIKLGLSAEAALTGGGVGVLLGPVLYYLLLRKALSVGHLSKIVVVAFLVGVASANLINVFTSEGGWLSSLVTPIVAILLTLYSYSRPVLVKEK